MYPFYLLLDASATLNVFEHLERVFGLDQQTLITAILVLINAAILAFVLTKLLYKPVLNILHERRAKILEDVQTAEKEKADALKLKAEYEQALKAVEQEKQDILSAARKLADDKGKEQIAEAKHEAETIKARAQKDIELEQERVKGEMKQAVIDVSSLMTSKFLTRTMDESTHEQLFNETMAELEGIAWRS
jgi:F-type H+-transporting ATPase subunit b